MLEQKGMETARFVLEMMGATRSNLVPQSFAYEMIELLRAQAAERAGNPRNC